MTAAVDLVCDYAFARGGEGGLGLQRIDVARIRRQHPVGGGRPTGPASGSRASRRLGGVQRGDRLDDWSAALLRDDPARCPRPAGRMETSQ